ncbi:type II secretion system major pseudopilin GspG [Thalassotalea fonticola]|uniref:Type II secretion system core protein G n=1 Tax=Thalassotalea fonticola TaxID=3065649 RepID=A0ABZ0GLT1_9GAMM|nr:type II secretion system major pseudopilin GspG [Colwelliaceae bacterium S1-1]
MKVTHKKVKGFTLLEVMVVIVILGILGAMVVPNLMGNLDTAKIKTTVSDIGALEQQLKLYKMANYNFPSTEQGLEALVEETDIEPLPRRFPEGGYLPRLPIDPWGNEYVLLNPGENGIIDVFSAGPDGEVGTEDDIGNWNVEEFR